MKANLKNIFIPILLVALSIFTLSVFIWGTVIPDIQVLNYSHAVLSKNGDKILNGKLIFTPYTNAQKDIRIAFFRLMQNSSPSQKLYPVFLDKLTEIYEDLTIKSPFYAHTAILGQIYDKKGQLTKKIEYLEKAETFYKQAIEVSPHWPEFQFFYAVNLLLQKKYPEALKITEAFYNKYPRVPESNYYYGLAIVVNNSEKDFPKALDMMEFSLNNNVNPNPNFTVQSYQKLMIYFYKQKDKERFLTVVKRLLQIDLTQKDLYLQVLDYINKNNKFPALNFN